MPRYLKQQTVNVRENQSYFFSFVILKCSKLPLGIISVAFISKMLNRTANSTDILIQNTSKATQLIFFYILHYTVEALYFMRV